MNIFLNILLLVFGMIVVIYGGDIFVEASIKIGKKLKIPYIIIGATIVSIATTLPELIVSTISASKGSYGLALGNSVGSVICNTALISGLSIAILPSLVKEKTGNYKNLLLIFAVLLVFGFALNSVVKWYEALILFILFCVFMGLNLFDAIKESKSVTSTNQFELGQQSDQFEVFEVEKHDSPFEKNDEVVLDETIKKQKLWVTLCLFILGAGMIALGAWSMVQGATHVCSALGISDSLIGLTIVAIGTSLPELITTITAIKKRTASLGYGNIIGANIINLTLITSICGFISGKNGLTLTNQNLYIDLPVAVITCLLFVLPLVFKNKTYKVQGIALLSIYFCYILGSILLEVFKVTI